MTTVLFGIIALLVLLVLFFATGKTTPSRPLEQLPPASPGVHSLASLGRSIDAIKLYRRETGATLREPKQLVDSLHGQ